MTATWRWSAAGRSDWPWRRPVSAVRSLTPLRWSGCGFTPIRAPYSSGGVLSGCRLRRKAVFPVRGVLFLAPGRTTRRQVSLLTALRFRPPFQGRMSQWTDWPSACGVQLRAQPRICPGVPFSTLDGAPSAGGLPGALWCVNRGEGLAVLANGPRGIGAVLCRSVIAVIPALAGRPHPSIKPSCCGALCLIWICTGAPVARTNLVCGFGPGDKFLDWPGGRLDYD